MAATRCFARRAGITLGRWITCRAAACAGAS
nr:MAG TPA: hypothetical protein [Bacteriophage sp.]